MDPRKLRYRAYFKDFYTWNAAVLILFLIAYLLVLWTQLGNASWGKYWLIPVCYLAVLLTAVRLFILYFTARSDMKRGRIVTANVTVRQITRDRNYNFYNKGGALNGREKCLLEDTGGNSYRLMIDSKKLVENHLPEYYAGAHISIEYLERSRIALRIKPLEVPENKAADAALSSLKKDFCDYFL